MVWLLDTRFNLYPGPSGPRKTGSRMYSIIATQELAIAPPRDMVEGGLEASLPTGASRSSFQDYRTTLARKGFGSIYRDQLSYSTVPAAG